MQKSLLKFSKFNVQQNPLDGLLKHKPHTPPSTFRFPRSEVGPGSQGMLILLVLKFKRDVKSGVKS